jgi:hypothetical protein
MSHFLEPLTPSPANAIAFMKTHHLSGHIWNDFDWGGDLMWALPESRIACDGRSITAYSDEFLKRCIPFGYGKENPLEILKSYSVDFVVLPPQNPAVTELSKSWATLFCDSSVCLFSKKDLPGLRLLPEPSHLADFY